MPGSARQVPPWVFAGPVQSDFSPSLESITPGYSLRDETRASPRGSGLWPRYVSESLVRGAWHLIPCRYPDLTSDPALRSFVRWALERVRLQLLRVRPNRNSRDRTGADSTRLLEGLIDVPSRKPRSQELDCAGAPRLLENAVRNGLQALGWVVDERGLGGGQEMDGLAWQLPLERLWERYRRSQGPRRRGAWQVVKYRSDVSVKQYFHFIGQRAPLDR